MKISVTLLGDDCPRTLELKGRRGWAIAQLAKAGPRGVTALEVPALRWSAYVHQLRNMGFRIETTMEAHESCYAGHHARYRLACSVSVQVPGQEAQK